jgi:Protein of unknown function (DUF2723)
MTRMARAEGLALRVAPLLAAIVAFGLTRSTMLPGLGFWDTGEFQTVAPLLGTAHPTGYPTFVLLGWFATLLLGSVGEPAVRMNVLSGLLLACASALTVVAVRQIGGRTLPALAAGVLLALTPIPWLMGSFTDPHTLHLVMVAILLVLLGGWETRVRGGDERADRWLIAAAAVYGLSLGNHQLTLLLAPGIGLFLLATDARVFRRRALVLRCFGAIVGVAALVYLELPIRAAMHAPIVYGHPDNPIGFLYVALGLQFAGDIGGLFSDLPHKVADLTGIAIAQFGPMAALLPAAFVAVAARRPRVALLTGTWVVVTCLFAASYDNAMIERYYLGPILCAVVWLGAGASILVDAVVILRSVLGWDVPRGGNEPEAQPAAADGGPADSGPDTAAARGRDWFPVRLSFVAAALLVTPAIWLAPAAFPNVNQSGETSATTWSTWVFREAKSDAVIVSWWSFSTALWYRQSVLGVRPDITIVDDRDVIDENLGSVEDVIRANVGRRPVYLVRLSDEIDDLRTRWQLEEVPDPGGIQSLFLVVGPAAAAGGAAAAPGGG